jgi:hypothetical protein
MWLFPSAALLRQIHRGRTSLLEWLVPVIVVIAAAASVLLRHRRSQVIHKSLTM